MEITGRINTLVGQKRDWAAIRSELEHQLSNAQAQQAQLRSEYSQASLLQSTGDKQAAGDLTRLRQELTAAQDEITQLEAALQASNETAERTELRRQADEQKKREAALTNAHRDMVKCIQELDRSLDTLGKRYLNLLETQNELLGMVGRGSIQITENVLAPQKNFSRCLASHLPRHSGFERIDDTERNLESLLPNLDSLLNHIRKH